MFPKQEYIPYGLDIFIHVWTKHISMTEKYEKQFKSHWVVKKLKSHEVVQKLPSRYKWYFIKAFLRGLFHITTALLGNEYKQAF